MLTARSRLQKHKYLVHVYNYFHGEIFFDTHQYAHVVHITSLCWPPRADYINIDNAPFFYSVWTPTLATRLGSYSNYGQRNHYNNGSLSGLAPMHLCYLVRFRPHPPHVDLCARSTDFKSLSRGTNCHEPSIVRSLLSNLSTDQHPPMPRSLLQAGSHFTLSLTTNSFILSVCVTLGAPLIGIGLGVGLSFTDTTCIYKSCSKVSVGYCHYPPHASPPVAAPVRCSWQGIDRSLVASAMAVKIF